MLVNMQSLLEKERIARENNSTPRANRKRRRTEEDNEE